MCKKCKIEHTGLRSGKGTALLSRLLGRRSCNHDKDCSCKYCEKYPRQEAWWE